MKRLTVTLLALTLLAASAEADVTIKMSRTDLTEEKPTPQSGTTLLTGNKMASIWAPLEGRKDAGDDSHLIYRGDKQTIWVIKDSDKSYMEMTKASIDAMGQKLDGAMAQMKAELEKMPPEQRKMMEAQMKSMTGMSDEKPQRVAKKTGETKTIHGFPCVKYTVHVGEQLNSEVWATPMNKFGLSKADMQVLMDMAKMFESITARFKSQGAGGVMNPDGIDGVPVLTTTFDEEGKPTGVMEFQSVAHGAVDAAQFEVPAGYKLKDPMGGKKK